MKDSPCIWSRPPFGASLRMIEKSDSKRLSLATAPILGQPPKAVKLDIFWHTERLPPNGLFANDAVLNFHALHNVGADHQQHWSYGSVQSLARPG